jgi:hypothetical protein
MEAVRHSAKQATQCYNPEARNLNTRSCSQARTSVKPRTGYDMC